MPTQFDLGMRVIDLHDPVMDLALTELEIELIDLFLRGCEEVLEGARRRRDEAEASE